MPSVSGRRAGRRPLLEPGRPIAPLSAYSLHSQSLPATAPAQPVETALESRKGGICLLLPRKHAMDRAKELG